MAETVAGTERVGLKGRSGFPADVAALSAGFSTALAVNSANTTALRPEEAEKNRRLFDSVEKLVTKYGLVLNNRGGGKKLDPERLVFVFGGNDPEAAERQNYKFGKAEVGDGKSVPVSVTIPADTPYATLDSLMSELRASLLGGARFKSLFLDSHGGEDGWVGSYSMLADGTAKYHLQYRIFSTMTASYDGEPAPFYRHTKYLRMTGCEIFSNLTAREVSYLRNVARAYKVRIDGNTTDGWRCWGRTEGGGEYVYTDGKKVKGPGGNAFAFMPDGGIRKIRRPGDTSSFKDTDKNALDTSELEKAWKASGGGYIDEGGSPYQITYNTGANPITLYKK